MLGCQRREPLAATLLVGSRQMAKRNDLRIGLAQPKPPGGRWVSARPTTWLRRPGLHGRTAIARCQTLLATATTTTGALDYRVIWLCKLQNRDANRARESARTRPAGHAQKCARFRPGSAVAANSLRFPLVSPLCSLACSMAPSLGPYRATISSFALALAHELACVTSN